ncbi:MAG: CAP domain-containing protein [Candidatus Staskawiczbacteria bacterium]|nr:CAP domain-containing protein [Candidatus Staskawiczbacteria bacterium]
MARKDKKSAFQAFYKLLESNTLLYCVVLLLLLKILIVGDIAQNLFLADISKNELITFVNHSREAVGLNQLAESDKLDEAAYLKAQNMVQNQYFDHTSPTGVSPWYWFSKTGYDYKYAGENLAIGFFDSKEVYNAWLLSSSHRENILNPNYTEIGIAVVDRFGNNNTTVVVQLFGSPKNNMVLTKNSLTVNNNNDNVSQTTESVGQIENDFKNDKNEEIVNNNSRNNAPVPNPRFVLGEQRTVATTNLYSKILSYVIYDYKDVANNVIYAFSMIVLGILGLGLVANSGNFSKNFVFRSILIFVLIGFVLLLDKKTIISFIPHQTKI